jgi:D-alanyl-D-alanine carboxypeptidase/D-alanyl-D-alanine-endopeptidase (penicillin-binding protein 4)
MRRTRICTLLLIFILLAFAAEAKDKKDKNALAKRIDSLLVQPDVARGFWGVKIIDEASGRVLYEHDADRLFTPASNTKLVTTAAAFALVGPQHIFRTTIESNGVLDSHGRLTGDLLLVGRGDPNLSGRTLPYAGKTERAKRPDYYLQEFADQVFARGVRVIDGDIVGDDSFYVFERYATTWDQGDLMWEWGAPVSALSLNDNVLFLSIGPGDRVGDRALLTMAPFADYYEIDNRVMTTASGTGARNLSIHREPGSKHLMLWGTIPQGDSGVVEALAIDNPAEFSAQLLRQKLEAKGVMVFGKTRVKHAERVPASATSIPSTMTVLAEHDSPPLGDDLKVINKVSQNLHVELALRLIGHERLGVGSFDAGLQAERTFLSLAGITTDEYRLNDGSGLSRQNLISPAALVKLLQYAHAQSWGVQFEDTLPIGGVDGTLANRFTGPALAARVHAKTGTMGQVNTLSGYATTKRGARIIFSVMSNNHVLEGHRALEVIDAIVAAAIDDTGKK